MNSGKKIQSMLKVKVTYGEQLLEVIKRKLFLQNDMGPEISDKLAEIANNRWAEKQEKK